MKQLSMTLPCDASYIPTARMVAVTVARRARIPESDMDDVRYAIGEACAHVVELAHSQGFMRLEISHDDSAQSNVVTMRIKAGIPAGTNGNSTTNGPLAQLPTQPSVQPATGKAPTESAVVELHWIADAPDGD